MNLPWMYNWRLVAFTTAVSVLTALGVTPGNWTGTTPAAPAPTPPAASPSASPSATHTKARPRPWEPQRKRITTTTGKTTATVTEPAHRKGEVITTLTPGADPAPVLDAAARSAGAKDPVVLRTLATGALLVQVDGDAVNFRDALRRHDKVVSASLNARLTRSMTPSDPLWGKQWNLKAGPGGIDVTGVWDRTLAAGVRVAVLDSGKSPNVDLNAAWLGGHDFVTDPTNGDGDGRDADATAPVVGCTPDEGPDYHGQHVAGIIAARGNNGAGTIGVAPGARIVPIRVLASCGGDIADVMDAVVWAAGGQVPGVPVNKYPASILNLSMEADMACDVDFQRAFNMAHRLGAVVVTAAGNRAKDASVVLPGNCRGVLNVAAVGPDGKRASGYSNYGKAIALAAPGGTSAAPVQSTFGVGWAGQEGTSMAAPHVAGTAALLWALNPQLNRDEVIRILKGTTRPSTDPAGCSCGAGILDARKATEQVPVTSSASQDSTTAGADRTITVRGSGLTKASRIIVGDASLVPVVVDDRTLRVRIPATVPAGSYAVWATTRLGWSRSTVVQLGAA